MFTPEFFVSLVLGIISGLSFALALALIIKLLTAKDDDDREI